MPLYEFLCRDCQREQEVLVRGGEAPACEACGSPRMEKLLSVPAAHASGTDSASRQGPPTGPCGTACGCFPG